jgi:dienelactone hydrolase
MRRHSVSGEPQNEELQRTKPAVFSVSAGFAAELRCSADRLRLRATLKPPALVSIVLTAACGLLPGPGRAATEDLRQAVSAHHLEFIPEGDGPFPTLVAIPGCSGIAFEDDSEETTHPGLTTDDRIFRRHYREISSRLRNAGYAVLLIHVHHAEGLETACGGEIGAERIAEYIDEAVSWARSLPYVDARRVHVIGWSMGGGGALAWLHGARGEASSVRSVVAVYPVCRGRETLTSQLPLLLLLGGADDITPPSSCGHLLGTSAGGPKITVEVYPGARHGFDVTDAPPALSIGNGMTVGYQKEAADAAWGRILSFLTGHQ